MKVNISVLSFPAKLVFFAGAVAFASPAPLTSTSLSFTPSATVTQFGAASAVISVTSLGLPVTTGTVKLYQTKTSGVAGSCLTQNGNAEVQPPATGTPDVNGQVTFDLQALGLTNTIGTFGFIAKFTDPGNYTKSESACLDLIVVVGDGIDPNCPVGQNATISVVAIHSAAIAAAARM